jgi:hypothetical protein
MDIVQKMWGKFHSVCEIVLDMLETGVNYAVFQERLREELNDLGCQILKDVLEAGDANLRENREERPGWQVERKNEPKSVLSPFGLVSYQRTYYRHKATGKHAHLVDLAAGYGPHCRVDPSVKAEVVEMATELSYRKSGREPAKQARSVILSGQAVMKAIREADLQAEPPGPVLVKRERETLFIEADEDHVAGQRGKTYLPRLAYVHEGKEKVGKERYRLKEPYHFAGLCSDAEEMWLDTWSYIEDHYDTDHLKRVFVCGDGDPWIKKGAEILPYAVFVLDRFHLDKYIIAALGRGNVEYTKIWSALKAGNRSEVEQVIKETREKASTPTQRKAATELGRYIRRNWDGIMAYRLYPEAKLGVSAEGHVSHILSARLSSRPAAWSKQGVDQMARLRAIKANGISPRKLYLEKYFSRLETFRVSQTLLQEERQKLKRVSGEVTDNIPALNGPVTQLRRALKAIAHNYIT